MTATAKDPSGSNLPLDPILLVDDEPTHLALCADALAPNFEVTTATSTREASAILSKKTFKVVICDHLMPGGNGLSLLVDTRREYPLMQRVLVTAYLKPERLQHSVNEAGLYRYLLKPVSLPELIKTVTDAAKLHDRALTEGTSNAGER